MSNYQLKLLAAVLMVIDHVGLLFFPDLFILRVIGRLSFPLFAWLLVQGERHTKNFRLYLLRLLAIAFFSQPFYLFIEFRLNILFTLALGLVVLRLARLYPKYAYLILGSVAVASQLLPISYGGYGIMLIWLLSRFDLHNHRWFLSWLMLNYWVFVSFAQPFAVFAPFVLIHANCKQGSKARWFYWFYPAHLALLVLVRLAS